MNEADATPVNEEIASTASFKQSYPSHHPSLPTSLTSESMTII